jgi:ubiquinone/menaquinone biosynthesis C-methylase UbiE
MHGLDDGYFDVVFISNVFEHLTRQESVLALAEIRRVLKQGGVLIAIQPNFKYCWKEYFDDYTHVQIFTHLGLSALITASGLTVVDVKPRFLPFSMRSKLPKLAWLVMIYLYSPFKPFAGQMLLVAKK